MRNVQEKSDSKRFNPFIRRTKIIRIKEREGDVLMIVFVGTVCFFLGALLTGACNNRREYEYAKKLRRFKIRCDFEDAMRKLYPDE